MPFDEDMDTNNAKDEVDAMEVDNLQDVVEEVQNEQDLRLFDRFQQGLDVDDLNGPPAGFVDDSWKWGNPDCGDETLILPNNLDTGF